MLYFIHVLYRETRKRITGQYLITISIHVSMRRAIRLRRFVQQRNYYLKLCPPHREQYCSPGFPISSLRQFNPHLRAESDMALISARTSTVKKKAGGRHFHPCQYLIRLISYVSYTTHFIQHLCRSLDNSNKRFSSRIDFGSSRDFCKTRVYFS